MYNERKDSFSIRDVVIQLLFVILFVFILIWLFPTKSSVNGKLDAINSKFDVLTNQIFNTNLQTMKDAATNYYTTPRLPKNINDVKSMTLREMLNEKLLVEFKDANNKSCDLDASYVEITKYEDEFVLKVNLRCTDNDAYILVHMGCYDYCEQDICQKQDTTTKPVVNPQPKPTPSPTPDPKPEPAPTYTYQYVKVVNGSYTAWGNWSSWTTNSVTQTDLRQVQTDTRTTTQKEKVVVGYNLTTYKDTSKPIYRNKKVQSGTTTKKTCAEFGTRYVATGEYKYQWVKEGGVQKYYSTPANTSTTKYEYISSGDEHCGNCSSGMVEYYQKYVYKYYPVTKAEQYCKRYKTTEEPVYVTVKELVGYGTSQKKTPVYGYVNKKVSKKYYRYRTRSITQGYKDYKWSSSSNDQNLIKQGYSYTGVYIKK